MLTPGGWRGQELDHVVQESLCEPFVGTYVGTWPGEDRLGRNSCGCGLCDPAPFPYPGPGMAFPFCVLSAVCHVHTHEHVCVCVCPSHTKIRASESQAFCGCIRGIRASQSHSITPELTCAQKDPELCCCYLEILTVLGGNWGTRDLVLHVAWALVNDVAGHPSMCAQPLRDGKKGG